MLGWLRGLCDRLVLVACIVAGGTAPSFVTQYEQRLGGRIEQLQADLAPFQAIADRYHGGSLEALVAHHLASPDPTFHAEGGAIAAMAAQLRAYGLERRTLDAPLWRRLLHVGLAADHGLLAATWGDFRPSFALTLDGLAVAVALGLAGWLLFQGTWAGCAGGVRRWRGGRLPRSAPSGRAIPPPRPGPPPVDRRSDPPP